MKSKYCMHCMSHLQTDGQCTVCGHTSTEIPAHHLMCGTILNKKYLVGEALGEGGFGITYIGRDLTLNMLIAIKEYYPTGYANRSNTVSNDVTLTQGGHSIDYEKDMDRFLGEARALARFCNEPGIVGVRDYFRDNGTAYIVMEYLDGVTLKNYIAKHGPIQPTSLFKMMEPIMRALEDIHKQGLIHRDISPDNIILLKNGQLKLLDFGAAREVAGDKSISVVLKPGYAPEEQYRSKGRQGPWTDVYAMCATIYKCITGKTPDESIQRVFDDELCPPSKLGIVIGSGQENALMKGLSIKGTDRIQSMDLLRKALCPEDNATIKTVHIHRASSVFDEKPDAEESPTVYQPHDDPTVYQPYDKPTVYQSHDKPVSHDEPSVHQPVNHGEVSNIHTGKPISSQSNSHGNDDKKQGEPIPTDVTTPTSDKSKKNLTPINIALIVLIVLVVTIPIIPSFFKKTTSIPDSPPEIDTQAVQETEVADVSYRPANDIFKNDIHSYIIEHLDSTAMIGFMEVVDGHYSAVSSTATCNVTYIGNHGEFNKTFTLTYHNDGEKWILDNCAEESVEEISSQQMLSLVKQPTDVYADMGDRVAVIVEAVGNGLSYQWWWSPANTDKFELSSITSNIYTTLITNQSVGQKVYCVVSDIDGNSITTKAVTLNVYEANAIKPISIVKQPVSISVSKGEKATFSAEAIGKDLIYTWWWASNDTLVNFIKAESQGPVFEFFADDSHDGMNLVCVITDSDGNCAATDIVRLTILK